MLYLQAPSLRDKEPSASETEAATLSEDEVKEEIINSPAGQSRPKPRPAYKGRKDASSDTEDKVTKTAGPSGGNIRGGRNDSKVEDAGKSEKAKGKRKARDESDIDVDQPVEKKSRQKAVAEVEVHSAKPRSRGAGRSGNEIPEVAKPKRAKPASRAEPKAPAHTEDEDIAVDDDSAPKKKKRKINIFPAAQPTSFPWGQLTQVGRF
jgi:hypothetical protein